MTAAAWPGTGARSAEQLSSEMQCAYTNMYLYLHWMCLWMCPMHFTHLYLLPIALYLISHTQLLYADIPFMVYITVFVYTILLFLHKACTGWSHMLNAIPNCAIRRGCLARWTSHIQIVVHMICCICKELATWSQGAPEAAVNTPFGDEHRVLSSTII